MEQQLDPTVQRRRLRIELRRARTAADLKQRQVADDLGWSPSKLLRIENGQVGVSQTDLRALLNHYGVTDPEQIKTFTEMAQQGRKQQTWNQYRDVLYPDFITYLNYEGSASLIRQTEPLIVPGMLQTEEYALAANRAFAPSDVPMRDSERQTEARMLRQRILERDNPPEMFFILDEAVVRRRVSMKPGDTKVMTRQLQRLQELNDLPQLSIQIVPFSRGLHFGMEGAFTMLEFPDAEDDEMLFLENRSTSVSTKEGGEEIVRYKEGFFQLEEIASKPAELPEFLNKIIKEMA